MVLGRYNYTEAGQRDYPGFHQHIHRNEIEICFLVKGRQTYYVGSQTYTMRGGDVFITFPEERHGTGFGPEEKGTMYWLRLAVPTDQASFLDLPPAQAQAVLQGLLKIQTRHFYGSPKMKEHLDSVVKISQQPIAPLRTAMITNRIHAFLFETIACSRRCESRAHKESLSPVIRYIGSHPEDRLSVPELAAKARLSLARFNMQFKEETGVPPAEYVLRSKVEEARRRLEEGQHTVTRIAYDLGFSSSQYFATVFKRIKGYPPSRLPIIKNHRAYSPCTINKFSKS